MKVVIPLILSASYLRSKSPSAENKKNLKKNNVFTDIKVTNIEKIGNYAIKISFNDLHNTGIYSWKYIFKLGKGALKFLKPIAFNIKYFLAISDLFINLSPNFRTNFIVLKLLENNLFSLSVASIKSLRSKVL